MMPRLTVLNPLRLAALNPHRLVEAGPLASLIARFSSGTASADSDELPPPVKARLRAWWDGVDVSELPPELLERAQKDAKEGNSALGGMIKRLRGRESEVWDDPRLTVLERLWGEGMSAPGGRDFVLAMIASLGINKKMGLLEIGAGLGGSTRIIAKETGAWVSGLEPDAGLAKAGMELSGRAKLKKRASIEHCDLANLDLDPASYPVIFSLTTFYKVPDKADFYGRLYKALKSDGQLQFTDLMVPEPNPQGEAYEKWASKERQAPHPWTMEETRSSLEYHGFEVRIAEDITPEFSRMALLALSQFAGDLAPGKLDKSLAAAVLDEVELWSYRLALFEAGQLSAYRVYARKKYDAGG